MTVFFLLYSDTGCFHGWYVCNFINRNDKKMRGFHFCRKKQLAELRLQSVCILWYALWLRHRYVSAYWLKTSFYHHIDYTFSQTTSLSDVVRTVPFCCWYRILVGPTSEYLAVARSCITTWGHSAEVLCSFVIFFSAVQYHYVNVSNYLKFYPLSVRWRHLDRFFHLLSIVVQNFAPLFSETVPNRSLRDFTLFIADLKRRNCPSAEWASVANAISRVKWR
jgi:hypothetical protein